jgi:hypothetical protein
MEGTVPDTGDRQPRYDRWDRHRTAGTGVSGDGDRAVVGCVIVLGADRGGESHDYAKKYAKDGACLVRQKAIFHTAIFSSFFGRLRFSVSPSPTEMPATYQCVIVEENRTREKRLVKFSADAKWSIYEMDH